MKRSFLEELGLEKDVIDKIMAENGKDVEKVKDALADAEKERDDLKESVADRDKQLEDLKKAAGDNEQLQKTIEQLQADNKQIKIDAAVEKALTNAKAKNIVAVKALLGLENPELAEDGTVKGLAEKLEAVKKDNDYLFNIEDASSKKPPEVKGARPGEGADDDGTHLTKDPKDMTYDELCAYLNQDGAELV